MRRGVGRCDLEYFTSIFSSSDPGYSTQQSILRYVDESVTPTMNQMLTQEFIADEVRYAPFQMHPIKAPSPDGILALFYQKYWNTIGPNVTATILSFLNHGDFCDGLHGY